MSFAQVQITRDSNDLKRSTISFRLTKLLERLAQVNQSREKFSMLQLEGTRSVE
ncbi:hypothetical protein [Microcoleus sp.]|uniref:hypothetical protein n=1 Tax=Microcoleus sp. TaxID=44472 RepID=UPI00403E4C4D